MAPKVQCPTLGSFQYWFIASQSSCHPNTPLNSFSEVSSPSLSSSGFLSAHKGPQSPGSLCLPLPLQLPDWSPELQKPLCPTPVLTVEPWSRAAIKAACPGLCRTLDGSLPSEILGISSNSNSRGTGPGLLQLQHPQPQFSWAGNAVSPSDSTLAPQIPS